jgi:putative SOS response-associated peptidase YedK
MSERAGLWVIAFSAALKLLRPFSPEGMAFYRVGPHVNSARNDDPTCIVPLNAA